MSVFSRFANLFRSQRLDHDLDEEMQSHLAMRAEDNARAGMTEHDAQLDARRRLGNETLLREKMHQVRTLHWLETILQDMRYGLRMLRRSPGFAFVAVLTMALSIGATTAVFTLVESVLLRPLPYREAGRLVTITATMPRLHREIAASPDYFAWRDSNHTLAGAAGYDVADFNFSGAGDPDRLKGAYTTANFFSVLGIQPQLGRGYTTDEDKPGAANVAVLCYSLWQTRFQGATDVAGRKILLDGEPTLVIGVMPKAFRFPDATVQPEFLVPLRLHPFKADPSQPMRLMKVLARTNSGVSLERARYDLDNLSQQLTASFPVGLQRLFASRSVLVRSLQTELVGGVQRSLWVALAAVGFVLLIGCLNIASLQLARAIQRGPEVGIRSALGAGKGRLLRQLFTENLVLSSCGACGGLALALGAVRLARAAKLHALPVISDLHVDGWVLAFTMLITIASGFLFGLAPALWAARSDPAKAISKGARATSSPGHRRMRNLLVVTELSLALVLLAGAGLMIHSFARLMAEDPGFNPHDLLTAQMNLLETNYPTPERRRAFTAQLSDRLRSLPGVESVAAGSSLPLQSYNGGMGVIIEGQPEPLPGTLPIISSIDAMPGYFHALETPILAGRDFKSSDNATALPVAIVNQSFVRQFFPDGDALGKRFRGSREGSPWISIVGVIGDVRHLGVDQAPSPEMYFPVFQADLNEITLSVALRTHDVTGAAAAVRNEVKMLDANQPVFDVVSMDALLSESVATRRFSMFLLGAFALLALVLAAVGIYGVLSYSVAQRSREIGIRVALGSTQGRVLKLVLGEAALLTAAGIVIGVGAALALTRFMAGLLYNVRATDPLTLFAVSALLIVVGLLAGFLPARRASRVDPMIVLRSE
jgi:putative ABC transport system permease protein